MNSARRSAEYSVHSAYSNQKNSNMNHLPNQIDGNGGQLRCARQTIDALDNYAPYELVERPEKTSATDRSDGLPRSGPAGSFKNEAKESQTNRSNDKRPMRPAGSRMQPGLDRYKDHNYERNRKLNPKKVLSNESLNEATCADEMNSKLFSDSTEPAEEQDELCAALGDATDRMTNDETNSATGSATSDLANDASKVYDEPSAVSGTQIWRFGEQYAPSTAMPNASGERWRTAQNKRCESNELNAPIDHPDDRHDEAAVAGRPSCDALEESDEDQVHGSVSSFLLNEFESILRWVNFTEIAIFTVKPLPKTKTLSLRTEKRSSKAVFNAPYG